MDYNRRYFLRQIGMASVGSLSWPLVNDTSNHKKSKTELPKSDAEPSAAQKAWLELEFGLFIHFGIKTVYLGRSSDGKLDPAKFNPTQLDTDRWCKIARDAGMNYLVPVTKHHDGFCLWPSKYTEYSVKNTPYNCDFIGELVNTAEKHDLNVGFYYSLSDENEETFGKGSWAYINFMKNQLEELLTRYGDVVELWLDGFWKKQQHGWTEKPEGEVSQEQWLERANNFIEAWRMKGAYRWQRDHVYQFVKELQPDCLVMNDLTTAYPGVPLLPVHIHSGERYTEVNENDRQVWSWLGDDIYLPMQIETTMSAKGNERFPSGNWFWHEWDDSAASVEVIRTYLQVARKMKANLLLNVGPNDKGRLRPIDIERLGNL